MKRFILWVAAFLATVSIAHAAWTVTPIDVSQGEFTDSYGTHFILRLKCVSDGSVGSFIFKLGSANLPLDTYNKIFGKFMYSISADPGIGTTAAIQPVITNAMGATVFANTTGFSNTAPSFVPGGSYNGYPPHFTDPWTITFNDIGDAGEVYILDFDFLR